MALVLDSLQAVPADSALYTALEAAFARNSKELLRRDHEPQQAPASLARLRVTGELTAVGGDSLRFEAPELAEVAQASRSRAARGRRATRKPHAGLGSGHRADARAR